MLLINYVNVMLIKSYKTQILIFYILFIFVNSIITKEFLPDRLLLKYDKPLHFVEFFIFGFLLMNAIIIKHFDFKKIIICLFILTLIPLIDENLQYFFDILGRRYDAIDLKMNLIGSYFGVGFFMFIYKIRRKCG